MLLAGERAAMQLQPSSSPSIAQDADIRRVGEAQPDTNRHRLAVMIIALTLATVLATLFLPGSAHAASPSNSGNNGGVSKQAPKEVDSTKVTHADVEVLGEALKSSSASRSVQTVSAGKQVTYTFKNGMKMTFVYDQAGNVVTGEESGTGIQPLVSAGFDPHGYIQLDPSEQGVGTAGLAGTIGTVICAALAVETVGLGCLAAAGLAATVVAVAAAHGVCPHGQDLRIHVTGSNSAQCV